MTAAPPAPPHPLDPRPEALKKRSVAQLRPYFNIKPPLFDGLSVHEYDPGVDTVMAQPPADRIPYVASYGWASAFDDAKGQHDYMGSSIPIWLTEFGFGLDRYNATTGKGCLLETLNLSSFGALHGAFHAGRILGAINAQIGCTGAGCAYAAVTFETFVYRDPAPTLFPLGWCGMPAGTVANCVNSTGCSGDDSCAQPPAQCAGRFGQKNRPDLARVTGTGQLVAHLAARALAMETMHAVNATGGPMRHFATDTDGPLGDQPCVQAAAFRSSTATVFAVLNICKQAITMAIGMGSGTAVVYDLLDKGGKAPLPTEPDKFPWPSGPLAAKQVRLAGGMYMAPPLSFAIVETGG